MRALDEHHCLVVRAVDSRTRGRGFESGAVYWIENCCSAMKKENGENKGSQIG